MTNTKFRRRALISSVAMLLVALVALGSATFAWFTSSTTATADQLSVKTVKASELKVSSSTSEWTDQLHYGVSGRVLKPASSYDGTHWFAATADGKSSYEVTDTDNIDDISNSITMGNTGNYVFFDQLNVSNAGAAAVENVTISFQLSEIQAVANKKYLRMALVPATAKGSTATINASDFRNANYHFAAGADSAYPLIADSGSSYVSQTAISATSGASGSVVVGHLDASTGTTPAKYYNLYIWFEGQDEDCYDTNAGNEMPSITFTVTGDTATQS